MSHLVEDDCVIWYVIFKREQALSLFLRGGTKASQRFRSRDPMWDLFFCAAIHSHNK